MMPVRVKDKPSRPLRLSQPNNYSDIVHDMKATKKSRDWRAFAVFEDDDFLPMDEVVKKRIGNKRIGSCAATDDSDKSVGSSL